MYGSELGRAHRINLRRLNIILWRIKLHRFYCIPINLWATNDLQLWQLRVVVGCWCCWHSHACCLLMIKWYWCRSMPPTLILCKISVWPISLRLRRVWMAFPANCQKLPIHWPSNQRTGWLWYVWINYKLTWWTCVFYVFHFKLFLTLIPSMKWAPAPAFISAQCRQHNPLNKFFVLTLITIFVNLRLSLVSN